jgi:hypothetical protein
LPKKLSLSSQKYGFGIRDPGSEIRDPEKTYSGSRIQGSKRHRIPDPGSGSATLLKAAKMFVVGAGAVIRIYGSEELEQKEIFTAPQHCKAELPLKNNLK